MRHERRKAAGSRWRQLRPARVTAICRHSAKPMELAMPTISDAMTTGPAFRGRKNEAIVTGRPLAMSSSPTYRAEAIAPLTGASAIKDRICAAIPPPMKVWLPVPAGPLLVSRPVNAPGKTVATTISGR